MEQIAFGFFHQNIDKGIVSYPIWIVVPIPVLIFAVIGLFLMARRRQYVLLTPIAVGLIYWVAYAFVMQVFIIEYTRIAAVVALLLIVPVGIGLEWSIAKLPKRTGGRSLISCFLLAYAAAISIYLASIYPIGHPWTSFILHQGRYALEPSLPVNRYITPDDLKLFSGIEGARFIAPPWKALAVSAATGNYPLETKPATIGVSVFPYSIFMSADCTGKAAFARTYHIDYVYSDPFDCPGFSELGKSAEDLYLYKASN